MTATLDRVDLRERTNRHRRTWAAGRYARIGTLLQFTGELLAEAMDLSAGARFLDVAAGNGNLTLAAARRFAKVTATDIVSAGLIDAGDRAGADDLRVELRVADAEALPFDDGAYDHVGSTFGVMFARAHEQAAAELLRVVRPGGSIGLACWTPEGFLGDLLGLVGRYAKSPKRAPSPVRWGTRRFLDEAFGASASSMQVIERDHIFRFRSPRHFVDLFAEFYGPIRTLVDGLDLRRRLAFETDLLALVGRWNTASDGTVRIPGAYLEAVIRIRD